MNAGEMLLRVTFIHKILSSYRAEYFIDALKIYDEFKFVRKIYDIGLIDIEK